MRSLPFPGFVLGLALSAGMACVRGAAQTSPLVARADVPSSSSLPDEPTPQQQTAPASQSTPPATKETEAERKTREQHEEAEREVKQQEKQRLGGVMPQFNVVMNGKAVPLTPKEKFSLSFHTIIDPYTFALAALIGGGYGELTDDHTGYGHGPAGYFKRVGASYADSVVGNVVGNAALPVLLHQDPRYFRKGTGPIRSRIVYSALTTFICRSDSGKLQFNTSNVLGNFVAGGLSNLYYPSDERGVGLTISNATAVTLEGMLGAQILEFSPDIADRLRRRRERRRLLLQQQGPSTAPVPVAAKP